MDHLEFEKPIATLEKKLNDLRELAAQGVDLKDEIRSLEQKVLGLIEKTYRNLTPWQSVQLSRHPNRPYTRDYIENLFPDFQELHGDRCFGDDKSIMCGIASWPPLPLDKNKNLDAKDEQLYEWSDFSIMIMGHQKGRTTKQKMERNFGMARPEGYRKAMRLMMIAERARMPIITFIDTPGAYPGIGAEERGQAQAIAESIQLSFSLTVPVIAVVIGEGGSGGALAVGVANKVYMLQHSYYSVIAPESCASILWSDSSLAERASEVLKMSAKNLLEYKVIDGIIPEPLGGAHRDWDATFKNVAKTLNEGMTSLLAGSSPKGKKTNSKSKEPQKKSIHPLMNLKIGEELKIGRFDKFRKMGSIALAKTSNGKDNQK